VRKAHSIPIDKELNKQIKTAKKLTHKFNVSDNAGVAIFLIVIVVIIAIMAGPIDRPLDFEKDQKTLLRQFTSADSNDAIIVRGSLDTLKVEELATLEYDEMKVRLGITSDFVLYFEDGQGNIIQVSDKQCIGSGDANINGIPCN